MLCYAIAYGIELVYLGGISLAINRRIYLPCLHQGGKHEHAHKRCYIWIIIMPK